MTVECHTPRGVEYWESNGYLPHLEGFDWKAIAQQQIGLLYACGCKPIPQGVVMEDANHQSPTYSKAGTLTKRSFVGNILEVFIVATSRWFDV
jgi:hypothetical protein